jgi:prepilin-type N-terminal cleavage/methylation domain-containing protein/prepilin-type processing-associated H-X9-DG protein
MMKQKAKSGFTLIELLVVVAILSVLIAILLPSLSQARRLARLSVCSNQLHQIGTADMIYGTDYNDQFPRPGILELDSPPRWGDWYVFPASAYPNYPYHDDTIWLQFSALWTQVQASVWYWPYLGKVPRYMVDQGSYWTLAKIPSQPKNPGPWWCPNYMGTLLGYSYSYNNHISSDAWTHSRVEEPSRTWFLCDPRHTEEGGYNYLMLDGHVKYYLVTENLWPINRPVPGCRCKVQWD